MFSASSVGGVVLLLGRAGGWSGEAWGRRSASCGISARS